MTKSLKPIPRLAEKAKVGFRLTLVLYFLLLSLLGYWNLTRASGINWPVWAIQSLPLLLLLPGLLNKYYRSFSWLCFLLLFYFIQAVQGVFMSNTTPIHFMFLAVTVGSFISAMLTSRWLQRIVKELQ